MREWKRIDDNEHCGMCGKKLARGAAVLVITIDGLKRKKFRCEECSGLQAPPDLPPVIERSPMTKPMQPLKRAIPRDFKIAQGNNK